MTHSTEEMEEIFKDFFINECGLTASELLCDNSLFISGLLDSLDVLKLISFIEKNFQLKFVLMR